MAKYDRQPYAVVKRGEVYYYRLEGSKAYRTTGHRNPIEAKAFARARWEEAQDAKRPGYLAPKPLAEALAPFYGPDCPHVERLRAEGKNIGQYHIDGSRATLTAWILPDKIGRILTSEIRRADILEFRARMIKAHGMGRKVQKIMQVLKTCLKELYFREELDRDPTVGIGQIKVESKPRDRFTNDELARLFAGRPGNFASGLAWDVFRFAALTGMRRGEILALSWPQIDLVENTVAVNRAWKMYGQEIGKPKWEKVRRTPLLSEAREIILRQENRGEFVFCYPTGEHLGGTWWEKNFKTALRTAGIDRDGLSAHSLRHTINSIWRAAGVPDYVIRSVLGWTSEAVQDGYSHITADDLKSLPSV